MRKYKTGMKEFSMFRRFLFENGAFNKYYDELNGKKAKVHLHDINDYILDDFMWYDSSQGFDFWHDLHEKWVEYDKTIAYVFYHEDLGFVVSGSRRTVPKYKGFIFLGDL